MNTLFPIFLKLENLQLLLVGAGNVGLEKLEAILKNSPKTNVKVVAPWIKPEIEYLARSFNLVLVQRNFQPEDLIGIDLVMAATDSKEVNAQVREEARKLKLLVNVADTPDLCDFYLGSVVRKGDLKVGISTNGKSPTFAKRFRELLEETLPEGIQEALDNLKAVRDKLKGDFSYKVDKLNEITRVMKDKENL